MILTEQMIEQIQEKGNIPGFVINRILQNTNREPMKFAHEIIQTGYLSKDDIGPVYGDTMNVAYLNLESTLFHEALLDILPKDISLKYQAIPIYQIGPSVTVAFSNPADIDTLNTIRTLIGKSIDPVFSFPDDILSAIQINYHRDNEVENIATSFDFDRYASLTEEQLADLEPVIEISESLLMLAVKEKTSDIHIEPKENEYLIRFRNDGVLSPKMRFPSILGTSLVARYKVMSKLDITERRKPQDGKISLPVGEHKVDIRVSTLPSTHGEKIVMRVLGSAASGIPLDLSRIGLSRDIFDDFKEALKEPNGIIFVTGPTGSGKTTTLYAALNELDQPDVNIMTIEDPVEYQVPTITQSQVDIRAGRTFASILRAALRQDPDIILVGEIRDGETAGIASEAALTGHLVLSTLHTNNALQAVTRLIDMGVEPYIVAPALVGVLAQRLVRKNCEHCIEEYTPDIELLQKYFYWDSNNLDLPVLFHGTGCEHCGGTGFSGRIGIHEFVHIKSPLRDMILSHATFNELKAEAEKSGFRDMRYDGFKKAFKGITTIDEVIRVTASS